LYDVELSFAPDGPPQTPAAEPAGIATLDQTGSSLLTALREQLGLKLNSEKETMEILVVDRIDRPSEN
jgi:uncharacterized protein (TIGR03435 family)